MTKPTIFVTDGDGCIGYPIVREFVQGQHRNAFGGISCSILDMPTVCDLWEIGAVSVPITPQSTSQKIDSEKLVKHLKQSDVAIIVPDLTRDDMVELAQAYINACKEASVKHVLLLSLPGTDESSSLVTVKEFGQIEEMFRKANLPNSRIVRYGLLQNWFFMWQRGIWEGHLKVPLHEDAKFAPVNICDLSLFVTNLCASVESESKTEEKEFKLTGPELIDVSNLVESLKKVTGRDVKYQRIDRKEAEKYMSDELNLGKHRIQSVLDIFELVNEGKLNFVSHDEKKTIGQEPMSIDKFLTDNKGRFVSGKKE